VILKTLTNSRLYDEVMFPIYAQELEKIINLSSLTRTEEITKVLVDVTTGISP
jgi:hypothetical protein